MTELHLKDESHAIIGAAIEVYNELGAGFLEAVYHEAMEVELTRRQIPFTSQSELVIHYKNQPLRKRYVPDLICYGKIIVELKAVEQLTNHEDAQLHNYLHATGYELGLMFNFGSRQQLEWRRRVYTKRRVPVRN